MRIIDNKHDYYDYLGSPTDTLVFDRRNSFLLTKELVCDRIRFQFGRESDFRLLLLQCGASFWLFLLTITERNPLSVAWHEPTNYKLELLSSWKDYNATLTCISFKVIEFDYKYPTNLRYQDTAEELYKRIKDSVDKLQYAVQHNDYRIDNALDIYTVSTYSKNNRNDKTYNIPILAACGVSEVVSPVEVFASIEEYFSIMKTASEKTEAIGTTNDDKIVMHGFDTKTSFRGKNY